MTSTIALIEPVAWASSSEYRRNQLLSAAQYKSALTKNVVEFDIPLVPLSELTTLLQRCEKAEAEVERRKSTYSQNARLVADYTIAAANAIERAELAERQRDEALKALEPFAKASEQYPTTFRDTDAPVGFRGFNLGDLRAARNAMGEPE